MKASRSCGLGARCKVQEPHRRDEARSQFPEYGTRYSKWIRTREYWWSLRAGCDRPDRAWPWRLDGRTEGECIVLSTMYVNRGLLLARSHGQSVKGMQADGGRRCLLGVQVYRRARQFGRTCAAWPERSRTGGPAGFHQMGLGRGSQCNAAKLTMDGSFFVDSHSGTRCRRGYRAHRVWPSMREKRSVGNISQENRSATGSNPLLSTCAE